jgi:hypothetical protein
LRTDLIPGDKVVVWYDEQLMSARVLRAEPFRAVVRTDRGDLKVPTRDIVSVEIRCASVWKDPGRLNADFLSREARARGISVSLHNFEKTWTHVREAAARTASLLEGLSAELVDK